MKKHRISQASTTQRILAAGRPGGAYSRVGRQAKSIMPELEVGGREEETVGHSFPGSKQKSR